MKQQELDVIKRDNKRIKILIVDDMTDNIEVAASVLAPEGFILLYAQSGRECIEIAKKEQPDIILLDIMMPEMDGIETCKKLKSSISTVHISVIFLTAKIDDETLASSFEAGGSDYISKPFSPVTLLSRVYNQLRMIHKQEALLQAQERLSKAEKNQFLGLLAGGIAHDFNNQLNGIIGFSDLIKDRTSDDKIIRLSDLITECGERCAVLTNNLLAFAGKGKYQIVKLDILEVLKATEDSILRKNRHLRMVYNCESASPVVLGDYSQISSIVRTVVTNAAESMQHCDSGVITFTISDWDGARVANKEVGKKMDYDGYLEIKISDTGEGIPEEDIYRVFEPFFTTKDLSAGGGMSLAAAYGIVENHGGEISIDSEVGEGTTVTILLPKELDEIKERKEFELNELTEEETEADLILVIDDNKMSRILLEDIITFPNRKVITANSGKEGVGLYTKYQEKISVVFLDYVMPQMTGKETLEKLLEINPNVSVYMVSGYKSEQSIQELIDIGAKGFIQKPFKCQEILEII